jgi:hypothetical protein
MICLPWRPQNWRRVEMMDGSYVYHGWEAPKQCLRPIDWLLTGQAKQWPAPLSSPLLSELVA